ncbi:lysophospholipid acyltransferase family protein [bacterium]|nr:lysophospholipid acyltransferase family protein [bacterium]
MITAEKSSLHARFLTPYFRRKLRRSFAGVHCKGMDFLGEAENGVPVVLYANHPGWWDAVLPIFLSYDVFRHDAYAMMEEKQLSRYQFFRKLGCFSVIRENPREAMRSLQYAASLLHGSDRVLWIFPQGELTSVDKRPLSFYPGTAHLLRALGDVTAIPVAFRYDFLEQERPEAFIAIGKPWRIHANERVDIPLTSSILQQLMEYEMDVQREDVMEREFDAYTTLLSGKRSINEIWDNLRGKLVQPK